MNLYDEEGREVIVEVAYSQKEARGIRYLERIEESNPPCFFGKIYHKDGKIRMYPVAVLEKEELLEDAIDQGKPPIKENVEAAEPCDQEKEKILETLLKDVSGLLEELYQSGFNTVHDSTLQEMEKAGKLAGQYGMEYLEGKMKALADGLSMRRHQLRAMPDGLSMRRHQLRAMPDKLAETYAELIEYLYLCRTKITLDMGRKFYQ